MLTVHHLDNSRSHRILWLLEELGVDYRIESHRRDPQTLLAPAALRAVHPLGKAPIVVDAGEVLVESGAIIEALLDRHDGAHRLHPAAGTPAHRRYRHWLHYAEGSLMPPLLLRLVLGRMASAKMPFFARPIARALTGGALSRFVAPQIDLHLDFIEGELAQGPWLAGADFSAADIQMGFPLEAAAARHGLGERRRIADLIERMRARPAYQRALERGGPIELLR